MWKTEVWQHERTVRHMNRMKTNLILLLLILVVGGSALWAQPIDRPVAMVKLYESEAISQTQFKRTVASMEKQMGRALGLEEKKQLLDQLVNEKLLIQAANKERVTVTESDITLLKDQTKRLYEQQLGKQLSDQEFQELIQNTGYTWDAFLSELRKGLLAQKYIKLKKGGTLESIPQPSDQEVSDYYTTNQHLFVSPEMVRFKQIFINPSVLATQTEKDQAKKKAQTILRELRAGKSFDNYWEVYDDTGRIKIGAMSPGILRRDDSKTKEAFGNEFYDALFSLAPGSVSEVVASKVGYHIITVLEKIPFKVLGLDDLIPPQNAMTVRNYIKAALAKSKEQEAVQKALNELVAELRRIAELKIFEENLTW